MPNDRNTPGQPAKMPPAETGNASNPSPHDRRSETAVEQQILNEKAEKYLREVSSIEDEPDAQDQEDMDNMLQEKK